MPQDPSRLLSMEVYIIFVFSGSLGTGKEDLVDDILLSTSCFPYNIYHVKIPSEDGVAELCQGLRVIEI